MQFSLRVHYSKLPPSPDEREMLTSKSGLHETWKYAEVCSLYCHSSTALHKTDWPVVGLH